MKEGVCMAGFLKQLVCLLSLCCLCSYAKAEDSVTSAYLPNKKYAKNIEVKTYLVTKEQVAALFSEKNREIVQKTNKELYNKEVYLLVRCKNSGNCAAFGVLDCMMPNKGSPISVDVTVMPNLPHM